MFGNKFFPEGYASLEQQYQKWVGEEQCETNWMQRVSPRNIRM